MKKGNSYRRKAIRMLRRGPRHTWGSKLYAEEAKESKKRNAGKCPLCGRSV